MEFILSAWGKGNKLFLELTPDRILSELERNGFQCTGRLLQLNSMENRVYQVELDLGDQTKNFSKYDFFRVVKFYRPGRWTKDQIEDEHQFIRDLKESDLPVVSPLLLENGETIGKVKGSDIYYCIYPRVGGRIVDELSDEQVQMVGRYLARFHICSEKRKSNHRIKLDTLSYGLSHLKFLLDSKTIPFDLESRYKCAVEAICKKSESWFEGSSSQRIHGDCHLGNILWTDQGPFWVDFDDMLVGPPIQDLWLLFPGRDEYSKQKINLMLNSYKSIRNFDESTLKLIEPLRALRYIHFSAWIKKRYDDASFQRAFPDFNSWTYWQNQVNDLEYQNSIIQN